MRGRRSSGCDGTGPAIDTLPHADSDTRKSTTRLTPMSHRVLLEPECILTATDSRLFKPSRYHITRDAEGPAQPVQATSNRDVPDTVDRRLHTDSATRHYMSIRT